MSETFETLRADNSIPLLPNSTTVVRFPGTPTFTGHRFSLGQDSAGNQTRFLLAGIGLVWFSFGGVLALGVGGRATVRLVSDTPGRVGTILASTIVDRPSTQGPGVFEPGFNRVKIDSAVDNAVHVEIEMTGVSGTISWAQVLLSLVQPWPVRARYSGSASGQEIPAGVDTLVSFDKEVVQCDAISWAHQGAGHRFFLSGVWAITATTRFVPGGGAGERYSALVSDSIGPYDMTFGSPAGFVSSNSRGLPGVLTATGGYNGSTPETMNLAYTGFFPAGSYIELSVWQTGSPILALDGADIWKNITFVLLSTP